MRGKLGLLVQYRRQDTVRLVLLFIAISPTPPGNYYSLDVLLGTRTKVCIYYA